MRSLPARPSLESLRKQAKRLARTTDVPLRAAQLALAREYGYPGWNELLREVHDRLGTSLEWAQAQARRFVHDNAVAQLKQLLADVPALLSWDGLLELATSSFGDSFDPERERRFTRAECAELLIDAGAVVVPRVCDALIEARARGLLQLFERKGLLPRTLRFAAALGDRERVRSGLATDLATVIEALRCACRLEHAAVAELLLDRAIALDPELGGRIDSGPGRAAFIAYLIAERALEFIDAAPSGPWQAYVMTRVATAVGEGDVPSVRRMLADEPALLDDACVGFQVGLVERATLRDRADVIAALIDLAPALPRAQTHAIEFALTYAKPHLVPLLVRIWPVPDDLPHAAGLGDLARVQRWFDASGEPVLGDLAQHVPCNNEQVRRDLWWGAPAVQQVLDTALAWAVINNHFEVADFLLAHGADIDTTWSSHEPASILHELAGSHENYPAMEFLVERGIDLTRRDLRWNATAEGWARYAAGNERVADWLANASRPPA